MLATCDQHANVDITVAKFLFHESNGLLVMHQLGVCSGWPELFLDQIATEPTIVGLINVQTDLDCEGVKTGLQSGFSKPILIKSLLFSDRPLSFRLVLVGRLGFSVYHAHP